MVITISVMNIGLVINVSRVYNPVICSVSPSTFSAKIYPIKHAGRLNLKCRIVNPIQENIANIAKSSQPPVYCIEVKIINANSTGK